MTDWLAAQRGQDRFAWLERSGDDFPFYAGAPVALSGRRWVRILSATLVAFLCLTFVGPIVAVASGSKLVAPLVVEGLFVGLPLLALAKAAPAGWRALFRSLSVRDILWMIGFALIGLIAMLVVAVALLQVMDMTRNPLTNIKLSWSGGTLSFLALMALQVLGEEVLTILPFLALLTLGFGRLGLGRKRAILFAWAGSSLVFALAHLPTYHWNLLQCLFVVGGARLVLTTAYVYTKNLWASTGAHLLYDWTILAVVALAGAAGLPTG